ncbi:MAG: hypothetical protein Q7R30_10610 [Acidobacteriota bacterium]|nr:hypothetical protein [Acidobacteriota bacterium]
MSQVPPQATTWTPPRFDVAESFDKQAVAALRAYLLDDRRKLVLGQ